MCCLDHLPSTSGAVVFVELLRVLVAFEGSGGRSKYERTRLVLKYQMPLPQYMIVVEIKIYSLCLGISCFNVMKSY